MGIENYNIATCEKCGREIKSKNTQASLKKELLEQGWTMKGSELLCYSCNGHHVYTGAIGNTKKIGNEFYVEVANSKITVHIPYSQFFEKVNINTLPSAIYLRDKLRRDGKDPDKIKYRETKKISVGGTLYFVANYVNE